MAVIKIKKFATSNTPPSALIYGELGVTQDYLWFGDDNNTSIRVARYSELASYATTISPTFTGTPIAPTAATGTNTTQIATTAFVLANSVNSSGVTSVATSGAITGGTITSTGTITHSTAAGYKHIPTGGSTDQILKYSASGTVTWYTPPWTTNTGTVISVGVGTQISGMSMVVSNATSTPSIATSISNAADFRTAIGAGTSNLIIGTSSSTAAAGNHTHAYSSITGIVPDTDLPYAGSTTKGAVRISIVSGTAYIYTS